MFIVYAIKEYHKKKFDVGYLPDKSSNHYIVFMIKTYFSNELKELVFTKILIEISKSASRC